MSVSWPLEVSDRGNTGASRSGVRAMEDIRMKAMQVRLLQVEVNMDSAQDKRRTFFTVVENT